MLTLRFARPLVVSLSLLSQFAFAGPGDPPSNYDEVRRADGSYRIQYSGIGETYEKISATRREKLFRESGKHFEGDNRLNLLPRVLTEVEMAELKAGVEQRAKALKMFFEDHYSGKKSYLKSNILPKEFVDQIVFRHGDQVWEGKIKADMLNWLYGPDILRLPNGTFSVVEDNFGYLGGLGDLVKAPETLLKLVPEYQRYLEIPNPIAYYQALANRCHDRAEKFGGKVIMLRYRTAEVDDNEEKRLEALLKKFGIDSVEFSSTTSPDGRTTKYLETRKDGVYVVTRKNGRKRSEKVGYLFIQGEISDMDSSTPEIRRIRLIKAAKNYAKFAKEKTDPRVVRMMGDNALGRPFEVEEADKLLRSIPDAANDYNMLVNKGGVPGLVDAIMDGKVGANYSPGITFAEDKEFYTAVPKLIGHYLKEKPILANIDTGSFRKFDRGMARFDESTFNRVFENLDQYVIKGVSGMGGAEVWIGPKMQAEEIAKLKALVQSSPSLFIFQKFLPLSVMEGSLVDLRLIADVGPRVGDVLTAPFPWGRASPIQGSGKVNISSGGSETAVFVRKTRTLDCPILLH